MPPPTAKNTKLALSLFIGVAGIGLFPVYYLMSGGLKVDGSQGLPRSASIRGQYMNTSSIDVGPDPAADQLPQPQR